MTIKLERDGKVMEVCNELQASVFIRNGYKVVNDKEQPPKVEKTEETLVKEKPAPKKRSRRKTEVIDDDDKQFTGLIEE